MLALCDSCSMLSYHHTLTRCCVHALMLYHTTTTNSFTIREGSDVLMSVGGESMLDSVLINLHLKKRAEPELHRLVNDTVGIHMERVREHVPATVWQLKAK